MVRDREKGIGELERKYSRDLQNIFSQAITSTQKAFEIKHLKKKINKNKTKKDNCHLQKMV